MDDWSAVVDVDGPFLDARKREGLDVYDRAGGGAGFTSGMLYALLPGESEAAVDEYSFAHGALVMTRPGDMSMATMLEVEAASTRRTARAVR